MGYQKKEKLVPIIAFFLLYTYERLSDVWIYFDFIHLWVKTISFQTFH